MKNLLHTLVIVSVATLTVSAAALTADRPDPIGKDGEVAAPGAKIVVKERLNSPLLKGVAEDATANVANIIGNSPINATARATLVKALNGSEADKAAATSVLETLGTVGNNDVKLNASLLRELNKGTSPAQVAKMIPAVAKSQPQASEEGKTCSTPATISSVRSALPANEQGEFDAAESRIEAANGGKTLIMEGDCANGLSSYKSASRANFGRIMIKIGQALATGRKLVQSTVSSASTAVLGEDYTKQFTSECRIMAPVGAG